jgi:hypothetical protein
VSFIGCCVPPPEYNAQQAAYVLTEDPIGFLTINMTNLTLGNFFDISTTSEDGWDANDDATMDAYVYSPTLELFVFLIGSVAGNGFGRITAIESTGSMRWTRSNADQGQGDSNQDGVVDEDDYNPLPNWTWDPAVVTPILSHDNATVLINFASEAVTICAFNLSTGYRSWNITNLQEDDNILEEGFPVPSNAAMGGLLGSTSSGVIHAGLYDRNTAFNGGSTANFNSGMVTSNTDLGTVNTNNSWVYSDTLCFGNYQGGIRGTPVLGPANLYASDQFWGQLGWNQQDLSSTIYNNQVASAYTPMALQMSTDRTILLGMRSQAFPTAYVARSGMIKWTTRTTGLTCDTRSVQRNPSPVVYRDQVYYACGSVWYAFNTANGSLYNYGNATMEENGSQGLFVAMSIVGGVLYTTERHFGMPLSYVTAWSTLPTGVEVDPSEVPSLAPTMISSDDADTSSGLSLNVGRIPWCTLGFAVLLL